MMKRKGDSRCWISLIKGGHSHQEPSGEERMPCRVRSKNGAHIAHRRGRGRATRVQRAKEAASLLPRQQFQVTGSLPARSRLAAIRLCACFLKPSGSGAG